MEVAILSISVIASLASLIFIPKNKILESHFTFLFAQLPTWILGLSAVELGLLEYPIRELSKVNRTSFIFEFLILPIICIFFNTYYPFNGSKKLRLGYYAIFCSALTVFEVILEKYTMVITYIKWHWYWTWISVCIILWLVRKVTLWFFRST